MSDWTSFLTSEGATIAAGDVTAFETKIDRETAIVPLLKQGILSIEGEKAKAFLQGQTTCDVDHLNPATSLPGAQCNPKGRMLCNFQLSEKKAGQLLMIMSSDLVAPTIASLEKYAVFFRSTLQDVSPDWAIMGLAGPQAEQAVKEFFGSAPENTYGVQQGSAGLVIKIADQCFQLLIKAESAPAAWAKLCRLARPAGSPEWNKRMIQLGLGQVTLATREMFVPQMLNLQATGAISFRKGCYTGQEVVARMKYLGKLKRRMYRLELASSCTPTAGADCRLTDGGQNVGNVVAAVEIAPGKIESLAVLTEAAAASNRLLIDNRDVEIKVLALPYSLEQA